MAIGKRSYLPNDWYPGGIPGNVSLGKETYIESSDSFASFHSLEEPGLILGDASGAYVGSSFIVGPHGRVTIGSFSVLNGCSIICNARVSIGAHCLIAWSSVITDSWLGISTPVDLRRAAMRSASRDSLRRLPVAAPSQSVVIEDNVWVGFGAVIMPGVRLGRGCIVGTRAVVSHNVPPYSVVVGDPARVVRTLSASDTPSARARALRELTRQQYSLGPDAPAKREKSAARTSGY